MTYPARSILPAGAHFRAFERRGERGITTIECMVVLSLLAVVLVGVTGLHLLAMSAGSAAEASSIATNLARARLEEVLVLPPAQILQQDNTERLDAAAAGESRLYTVRTTVDARDPVRLDVTVTVTWSVPYNAACASTAPAEATCAAAAMFSRTLQTRVYRGTRQ